MTNFGLGISAVKEVAAANSSEDNRRISTTIAIIRRLVWVTGILGTMMVLILSPWLSQLTFGNKDYTQAFVWLSITLLFQQLSNGQLVVLQGLRKLKLLAKANVIGNVLGLLITLPLYYLYGFDGIVPGMIGTSLTVLLLSWYFSGKVIIEKVRIPYNKIFTQSKNMLHMGFMISLSGLLTVGASYIVRLFIGRIGSIEQVGLYTAGFAIISTYVGLIFTAMGTDYYPRLSAAAHDNKLSRQIMNQQAEIALLILAPILIIFFVFINWFIIFLYSEQFIAVSDMIYWAALGMFFKVASWSIAYLFVAKGVGKLFFWNELITNIYLLILNLFGYYYLGLTGLGISFLISYFLYLIQVYIVARIKFNFSFTYAFVKIFILQFILAVVTFFAVKFMSYPYFYFVGLILILISLYYSFHELDDRLGLKAVFKKFRKKH